MITKLTAHGEGLALVIDSELLAKLRIDVDTPLQVNVVGETLTISHTSDPDRQRRFEAALESSNERYGHALKRLAE
jgi:antitoxin component of MazEF toxin-antitoxin module